MILFKSLRKRTSTGSYYDEKSLTKCYWDGDEWLFCSQKSHSSPSLKVIEAFLLNQINLYEVERMKAILLDEFQVPGITARYAIQNK